MKQYDLQGMPVLTARKAIGERFLIGVAFPEPVIEEDRPGYSFLFLWEDGEDLAKVTDVTVSGQTAAELFERLMRGGISPCHLLDAILDYLGE